MRFPVLCLCSLRRSGRCRSNWYSALARFSSPSSSLSLFVKFPLPLSISPYHSSSTSPKKQRNNPTYSPPFTPLVLKFEPTMPVHRHVKPALVVHVAVAVAPGVRQDTARLESGLRGVVEATAGRRVRGRMMKARVVVKEGIVEGPG